MVHRRVGGGDLGDAQEGDGLHARTGSERSRSLRAGKRRCVPIRRSMRAIFAADDSNSLRHATAAAGELFQQQATEQEEALKKHLAAQRSEMLERIPAWRDNERRDTERVNVINYARSVGFSEQEVAQATDARAVELLYKAMQWDNLQKKKPNAKKRTKQAPKMAKAGQPRSKKQDASRSRQQAMGRLNKERSVDAAVSYLMGNKT